jgi:hypothetical protein
MIAVDHPHEEETKEKDQRTSQETYSRIKMSIQRIPLTKCIKVLLTLASVVCLIYVIKYRHCRTQQTDPKPLQTELSNRFDKEKMRLATSALLSGFKGIPIKGISVANDNNAVTKNGISGIENKDDFEFIKLNDNSNNIPALSTENINSDNNINNNNNHNNNNNNTNKNNNNDYDNDSNNHNNNNYNYTNNNNNNNNDNSKNDKEKSFDDEFNISWDNNNNNNKETNNNNNSKSKSNQKKKIDEDDEDKQEAINMNKVQQSGHVRIRKSHLTFAESRERFMLFWSMHRSRRMDYKRILGPCKHLMKWKAKYPNKTPYTISSANHSYATLDIQPAGQYSTIKIDSYSRKNTKKRVGGDSWRIHVQGPASVPVVVTDSSNGTYEASFLLITPGVYKVTIYLDYTLCDGYKDPPEGWFIKG